MNNIFEKTDLFVLFNDIKALNESVIFIDIMSRSETQRFIVKLNTDQLRYDFVNSDGVLLSDIGGAYSNLTVAIGNKKDRYSVDLYDTGEFHESFRIENISGMGFTITSNPIKEDGTNLLEEWGEKVEGLTFESLQVASSYLLKLYQNYLVKKLLG